jgi:heme/copper-type cytochrome/quinol oxidase subunit 2
VRRDCPIGSGTAATFARSDVRRGAVPAFALLWLVWCVWSAAPGLAGDPPKTETAVLSPDGVQRATIIVDSYSYTPDHLIVKRGVPLELKLTSVTWLVPHNFLIDAPEAGLKVNKEVPAGKSITIRFTPELEGRYKFFCDKKLLFFHSHEEKGMTGTLEVR